MMSDPKTTPEEARFISLVKGGGATAVPAPDGSAIVWAGDQIRHLQYQRRERIGNALLARGLLQFGKPVLGSNAVQIEVVE